MEEFNFEKRISTLKNYFCPEIYIWNYCSNVKHEIDSKFEQKLNEDINEKTKKYFHSKWISMINKVDEVLEEMLSKDLTNKFVLQIDQQLN